MLEIGPSTRTMLATRPVDFRKGPDALAVLVGAEFGGDPYSGVIYLFRAKRSDWIKLVWWDGTELCLMAKTVESGGFQWRAPMTA
jgi:transposase